MILVSIVTATYNSERTILETYESLKNQTHEDWEWVVTDDCSIDSTMQKLLQLSSEDPRVKILNNEINSGAAVSRNNSLCQVKGDYIAFIDSDDLWESNKIEKQLHFMQSNNLDFSFTAYELVDENSNALNKYVDLNAPNYVSYKDMLKKKATLGCSTVMLRSGAFGGVQMPLLRTGQDYATWLQLLKSGTKAYCLHELLTKYRIMPGSISRNKFNKAKRQWQIYREVECLEFIESVVSFAFYAWRAVFRK